MYRDYVNYKDANFEELKGKIITEIDGLEKGNERIKFTCSDGSKYQLTYYEDCCASCSIEDVCGDLADLLNSEVLLAEVVESNENPQDIPVPQYQDSFTWAFYKLSTIKVSVTIRWYGESSGYYSETATFEKEVLNDK